MLTEETLTDFTSPSYSRESPLLLMLSNTEVSLSLFLCSDVSGTHAYHSFLSLMQHFPIFPQLDSNTEVSFHAESCMK